MDKDSRLDSVIDMPLKARTFRTLSRLMTNEELAISIAIFGDRQFLKPKEFIDAMRPQRISKYIFLALTIVAIMQIALTVTEVIRHGNSPTMIMYSVGLSLWMIPTTVFALDEHKNNIRKGRALSRVYWLAEFRNFRYIGQMQQEHFRPYFNMEEPDVTKYECLED